MTTPPLSTVVAGPSAVWVKRVASQIDASAGDLVSIDRADTLATAADLAVGRSAAVIVSIVDPAVEGFDPDDFADLRERLATVGTRVVAVTRSISLGGLEPLLSHSTVDAILTDPWSPDGFDKVLCAQLATFVVGHRRDLVPVVGDYFTDDDFRRAELRLERRRAAPVHDVDRPHPLLDTSTEDVQLEAHLVDAIDRALGHPPRIRVAPGTTLIEIGADVGGIFVVLDGTVRLNSRTPTGEQILHEQSTGSIIGLLSLASKRRAMLQCVAVTEVRAIPVTLEQLAHALDVDPDLSGLLNRVLIGSLARRLRRSDELQVELDQSLIALSEARAELVAQARMATLGDLSAGLAHELNNPTAAVIRSMEHVADDVTSGGLLDDETAAVVREHFASEPPSTSEVRTRRREFAAVVDDGRLAGRLADLGVPDVDTARAWASLPEPERTRRLAAARLGVQLHHAVSAGRRVQSLVDSLRAYVRGDDGAGTWVPDIDVERTIEHAVRLLSHRLDRVDLAIAAQPVPTVPGRPGALQIVWGNLVSNAIDAAGGSDDIEISIELDQPDAHHVRVRVTDNGPGIEPAVADRIFEPRFTTKHGQVRFGLGLGLSICRQIVHEHGGTITVDSRPGATVFTVLLPVEAPDE